VLFRYDAATVLTVLQELTHYTESKFDWNELVKKTTSGISNAREYQMLWRHLAYRYNLPENFDEEGDDPMVCVILKLFCFASVLIDMFNHNTVYLVIFDGLILL
jgi:hypothetical protein